MRTLEEWIGKTNDAAIPPRVRLRVWDKFGGVCQCGCTRKIRAGERWDCDHIVALINGGEHRESNLQPLLTEHHRTKTKDDVAEKSAVYAVRSKHLGIQSNRQSFPTNRNGKWKKKMDGSVVRRADHI